MAFILSIEVDPSLMRTRQLLLEREGHTVIGVMDEKAESNVCH
jgi:hypothetical protein